MNIKQINVALVTTLCFLFLSAKGQINYPNAKTTDQTDDYFGTKVTDPYRWLEDDNADATAAWVKEQNNLTFNFLSKIEYRDSIKNRMQQLESYAKYKATVRTGNVYFYFKKNALENQYSVFYHRAVNHVGQLFIDPNRVDSTGKVSITSIKASNNGKYLAFTISKAGSDWQQIRLKEIPSSKTLTDSIDWVKFSSIAWQGNGFYYSRYDAPDASKKLSGVNQFHKVCYHQIGYPAAMDQVVYEDKSDPYKNFSAQVTDDERYLIISISKGTSGNEMVIKDLGEPSAQFKPLFKNPKFSYNVIDSDADSLLVLTNDGAPNGKLIRLSVKNPEPAKWKTVIPETSDALITAIVGGDRIVAKYMHDASHILKVFKLNGIQENNINLREPCTVEELTGDKKDTVVFFSVQSFTSATSIYKYITTTQKVYSSFEPKLDFKKQDYETKQVWFTSKDGTKIPMFIVHKKGLVLDGNNPCLLFGYGGFNISKTPEFKTERLVFLEKGGVFVMANIRGGGEFGEKWHEAGTKLKKQNVFDDFIAAAEYLIKEKYTSSAKLAISGRSNGGLLVGACMTQRPDLFKVALPAVGVMDMLRFHKFTIGWAWKTDYGSSENEQEFRALYKYSPLHNLRKGITYPATLVTTADHDDRVVPAHSFKFIATLQACQKGENPVLIRVDTDAGHGAGKPTVKLIDEQADVLAFMMYNLGMKW